MKRFVLYTLFLLFSFACERAPIDELEPNTPDSEEMVDVVLRFGATGHIITDVDTSITRGTMPNVADESKVYNIYVYVFNSAGKKIYGHYFDLNSRTYNSPSALASATEDGWYVNQATSGNQDTWGLIKFKTSKAENCTIFAITNIDSRMVNVSAEKLGLVQTQDDLLNMTATLNHDFVERTGYFPMTGYLKGVNTSTDPDQSLPLTRIDAKVVFKIKKGNDAINKLEIKNWQLFNVSRCTYVMSRDARKAFGRPPVDSDMSGYFNTNLQPYETATIEKEGGKDVEVVGFSCYLLDNAKTPKKNPTTYHDRQRQLKNSDGTNGAWEYANDNSTYVLINATVIMNTEYDFDGNNKIDGTEENAILNADVQYIVHLGDFSKDVKDFNTLRNNVYTYTITVNGVEQVKVEVDTSNDATPGVYDENQPGATGEVTVSLQEIFEADAHYETRVITFNEKYIKESNEDMTWYVRTPFCKDRNEPSYDTYGTPITTGLDFRWVEFRLNKTEGNTNTYVNTKRKYRPHPYARRYVKGNPDGEPYANAAPNLFPGNRVSGEYDGTGYVDELVEFLRAQKELCVYTDGSYDYAKSKANGCLFDSKGDLKVTAFINEYYYERHPISGEWIDQDNSLWRRVLTLDEPRVMSILSDTRTSVDQESKVVGAAYSIRQKSIQSVYNHTNPNLTSAWGTEHRDETSAEYISGGVYYWEEHKSEQGYFSNEDRKNNDPYNGRLNTLKEWGLVNDDSSFKTGQNWETYFNFEVDDGTNMLRTTPTNYQKLRYACMTRNRDNDGDGIIDADEIRWYLASIQQLAGIYMGSNGIQPTARLYTRSAAQQNSTDPDQWREHVISSTQYNSRSNNPQLIWAEEGVSTGSIDNSMKWAGSGWDGKSGYSIRCVRNVNMDDKEGYAPTAAPHDYVDVYTMKNGVKTPVKASDTFNSGTDIYFDLQYLNSRSFRLPVGVSDSAYEPTELVLADDTHSLNNLYEAFVATNTQPSSFTGDKFVPMNENVTNSTKNPYCPDGYRLANLRELTLMATYAKGFMDGKIVKSRTSYSLGPLGSGTQKSESNGFQFEGTFVALSDDKATASRCVRDILPQNLPK